MRFKIAPEPVDVELLSAVHEAVPLVPGSVDDCCARIQARTAVGTREDAREWLTFLRALELAAETDRGYERRRRDPTSAAVADAFERRVFGAREVLAAVDGPDPVSADAAFGALRADIPTWERNRHGDWEAIWYGRVRRLLEWAVVFGPAARVEEGYEHR